jgi:hypothetical protein
MKKKFLFYFLSYRITKIMSSDKKRMAAVMVLAGVVLILIGSLTGPLTFSTRSKFKEVKYTDLDKVGKKLTVNLDDGKKREVSLPDFNYVNESLKVVTVSYNPQDANDFGYYQKYDESGPVVRIVLIVFGSVLLVGGGFMGYKSYRE